MAFEPDAPDPDADVEAWALFSDRAAIEAQMTAYLRDDVALHDGVTIAAA